MPFTFSNGAPVDQVLMPPMGWTPGQAPPQVDAAPQGAPAQLQQAPQPQATPMGGLPDIQVSPVEAFLSWAAHGGSPDEAARRVRDTKLANYADQIAMQQAQQRLSLAQKLNPRDLLDYLTNPAKFAESDAKNIEPVNPAEGTSVLFRGGRDNGGSTYFAPKTGVTAAGAPWLINDNGFSALGGQLPGEKKAEGGIIYDTNRGDVTGRYAVPQAVAPGSHLDSFMPGVSAPTTGPAPVVPTGAADGLLTADGRLDPGAFFKSFVLPHEGGYSSSDGNGAPVNMGVNQAANPGVDVSKLSPQQAQDIFTNKYFARSGAANLPPALAAVHADTYFIRPQIAQQLLQQSGGDPTKYLALRQAWMNNLEQSNPAMAKYAPAWNARNAALGSLIQQLAGQRGVTAAQTQSTTVDAGSTNTILPPGDPAYAGVAPGVKLQRDPEGKVSIFAKPNDADQKTVQSYLDTAKTIEDLATLGDHFHKMNTGTATGPLYDDHDVTIPLVHAEIPLNPLAPAMRTSHTNVRAMENLTNQLALAQRTPGMRITQMEFQKFLGSAPSINNPGPQNDKIVQGYHELAAQKRSYANFMSDWVSAHGSLTGADAAWAAHQRAVQASPGARAKVRVYNPATGNLE